MQRNDTQTLYSKITKNYIQNLSSWQGLGNLNIYYFKRHKNKVKFLAERNLYDIFKELNKSNMSNFLSCKKYHGKIKGNFE